MSEAAVWKHDEQQQSAATLDGPHDPQRVAFKRMPLTDNRYGSGEVAEDMSGLKATALG
jgi:hypothetical protein